MDQSTKPTVLSTVTYGQLRSQTTAKQLNGFQQRDLGRILKIKYSAHETNELIRLTNMQRFLDKATERQFSFAGNTICMSED